MYRSSANAIMSTGQDSKAQSRGFNIYPLYTLCLGKIEKLTSVYLQLLLIRCRTERHLTSTQ